MHLSVTSKAIISRYASDRKLNWWITPHRFRRICATRVCVIIDDGSLMFSSSAVEIFELCLRLTNIFVFINKVYSKIKRLIYARVRDYSLKSKNIKTFMRIAKKFPPEIDIDTVFVFLYCLHIPSWLWSSMKHICREYYKPRQRVVTDFSSVLLQSLNSNGVYPFHYLLHKNALCYILSP